ncbi:phosphocarrier protein HPr /dihydroxyacetone kinase DhaM subunit [Tamaricihabitans halophyticus]|uniref:Phosphocarrier protein HPr n=1 Tax=Tamaricihabitans halophyticus TaxID=1262583 RepID=A0A4R2R5I4_9PSEU|nr:dihydroxyacetone kinase phosphoryl donor subunit DhaM [Tamaricihabitans halophyticus]TCP54841.1 phosphocarrier protein HPr /dihydroxyacetone kinase DhaM subunit [Tamaricihabitans halophyticus]
MTVGIVLVSHSAALAEGLAELAGQMAPDVRIVPAGGLVDEQGAGLGTDYDAVCAAVARADSGEGVLLLYDLGSARMTAELAVESLAGAQRAFVADAPFVEGAVAAAVAAQSGAELARVATAAAAANAGEESAAGEEPAEREPGAERASGAVRRAEFVLTNEVGLHARPAALFARTVAGLAAEVEVVCGDQRAAGDSVLALMALGAVKGSRIEVSASGADAAEALRRIGDLVDRDFAE